MTHQTDWIMTASGRPFWPLEPRMEDIHIEDIAHALSHQCRYAGHCRTFFSTAQHSVLVSLAIGPEDPRDPLYALLHDAAEAYLVDVPRPLKKHPAFAEYRAAEQQLQDLIYAAFGLDPCYAPSLLKAVDRRMLRTEQRDLMPPPALDERRDDVEPFRTPITPWAPFKARWAFLDRFAALTNYLKPSVGELADRAAGRV